MLGPRSFVLRLESMTAVGWNHSIPDGPHDPIFSIAGQADQIGCILKSVILESCLDRLDFVYCSVSLILPLVQPYNRRQLDLTPQCVRADYCTLTFTYRICLGSSQKCAPVNPRRVTGFRSKGENNKRAGVPVEQKKPHARVLHVSYYIFDRCAEYCMSVRSVTATL